KSFIDRSAHRLIHPLRQIDGDAGLEVAEQTAPQAAAVVRLVRRYSRLVETAALDASVERIRIIADHSDQKHGREQKQRDHGEQRGAISADNRSQNRRW